MPPPLLPIFTSLIGSGGFTVGIYSFLNPSAASRIYGIPFPPSQSSSPVPDLTSFLDPPTPTTKPTLPPQQQVKSPLQPNGNNDNDNAYPTSLIHALGIRNLTAGLTILTLSSYWHFTHHDSPKDVRDTIQTCLGWVILVGSLVPFVDGWVCWGNVGRKSDVDGKVGIRAGWLHVGRGFIWVAGGLWCLLGDGDGDELRVRITHMVLGPR